MVNRVKEVVPNAKLVYNNSPSFNWTLNFRQQAYDRWVAEGKDVSAYDRAKLMSAEYDNTELAADADEKIRTFQADAAREAGVFHHLITLPTYHTAALSTHELAQGYFGSKVCWLMLLAYNVKKSVVVSHVLNTKQWLVLTSVMITKKSSLVKTHLKLVTMLKTQ
jgi:isocitrate lyase